MRQLCEEFAYVDIWGIFNEFPEQAPKNIDELLDYAKKCSDRGSWEVADLLFRWHAALKTYIKREYED